MQAEARLYAQKEFETKAVGDWMKLPAEFDLEGNQQYYFQIRDDYNDRYSLKPLTLVFLNAVKK